MKYIVLASYGKWEEVSGVKVEVFKTKKEALAYIKSNTNEEEKYWNRAQLIERNEWIPLH